MRDVLSSAGGFSGVALVAPDELPVSSPMMPRTAPPPATMNDTVDIVAIDFAELMG